MGYTGAGQVWHCTAMAIQLPEARTIFANILCTLRCFCDQSKHNKNRHYATATLHTCKSSMRLYQHCQQSVGRETACPAATLAPGTAVAPLCMQHTCDCKHRDYLCLSAISQVMLPAKCQTWLCCQSYGYLTDCSAVDIT